MSWEATAWALRQRIRPPARKLLLVALANYADKKGVCWPSQDRLAYDTEMSLDTIQRQTRKLRDDGFLSIARAPKRRGQWQSFVYKLEMSEQPDPGASRLSGRSDADPKNESAQASGFSPSSQQGLKQPGDQLALRQPSPHREGQTSECGPAGPQSARKPDRTAMRLKPSIEPSTKQSYYAAAADARRTHPADVAASACLDRRNAPNTTLPLQVKERLRAFQGQRVTIDIAQSRIAQRLGGAAEGWAILCEMNEAELDRLTRLEQRGQLDDQALSEAGMRTLQKMRAAVAREGGG